MTTAFARDYAAARGLPLFPVQHHLAHIHAVLAENRFDGAAIGLALDGTGLGEDGTLWGGECLLVDNREPCHERLGHFSPVRLPGGEAAIREPGAWPRPACTPGRRRNPWAAPGPGWRPTGPASALVADASDAG
jgi:hydrogenase maturation protein HypF